MESAKIRNNPKAKSKTVQNVHFGNYVKMKGRGPNRILAVATIDCVSTMAANEAKWVKQIIIRGLMCVTVKFDTIIHYKVCMDKISIYLHHLLNNEFTYLHSETLCARIFISMRNSLDGI